jgi:chorismate dehydratase
MVFGKIEYLNLLPFHVFMKRFTSSTQQKMSMHHHRGVPADINTKFLSHKVDAAFISSINAKRYNYVGLGIIAKKEVLSVLVIPHAKDKLDKESASSNVLAKILGINGEVLIGDKALKYYLKHDDFTDLAKVWHDRYNLPFVFALLCYHKDKKIYKQIEKEFLKKKVKIPQYILKQAAKRVGIDTKDILNYLEYISYKLDKKAKLGLKRFLNKAKAI